MGIWRRAVSAQEASAIYTAGQAGKDLSQAVAVSVSIGKLTATLSGNSLNLTWSGGPGIKLQQSPTISPANWTDVAGTLGASSASMPTTAAGAFFRLSN